MSTTRKRVRRPSDLSLGADRECYARVSPSGDARIGQTIPGTFPGSACLETTYDAERLIVWLKSWQRWKREQNESGGAA